ncbi:hypothetical protein TNCV_4449221 [Trichonephila clavipes]|nr:hypothetical protein TNCV_4449221 [Trichonephila clavipes]
MSSKIPTVTKSSTPTEAQLLPSASLPESVPTTSNSEHSNAPEIPQPRKSAPTEYATDEEDMITYDVKEEELEPDPTEGPTNFPKGYLRALTPTRFRKTSSCSMDIVVSRSSVVERKNFLINFNLEKLLSPLATFIGRCPDAVRRLSITGLTHLKSPDAFVESPNYYTQHRLSLPLDTLGV